MVLLLHLLLLNNGAVSDYNMKPLSVCVCSFCASIYFRIASKQHANESQASGAHKDASPARHTITSPHRTGVFAPVVRPTAVVPGLRSIPTSTDGTDGDEGLGVEFSLSPRRPGSTEAVRESDSSCDPFM